MRTLIALFWVTALAYALQAFAFVSMAVDGYDFSGSVAPRRGSLAAAGSTIADFTLVAAGLLMILTWIVMSSWAVSVRGRIPVTWRHSSTGVWLWWFVPVAALWKPRDVYLEMARAARPGGDDEIEAAVNGWWLAFVLFQVLANMRYLLGGAAYLVAASVALLALVTIASLYATRLVIAIGSPEVTFLTTMDQGSAREPGPAPTVPGWYYDPSGRANHQAYWDGGRWTGATRPDPLTFPAIPGAIGDGDAARKWFIILAIALTIVWLAAVVAFVGSEEPEVDRFALALLERA